MPHYVQVVAPRLYSGSTVRPYAGSGCHTKASLLTLPLSPLHLHLLLLLGLQVLASCDTAVRAGSVLRPA